MTSTKSTLATRDIASVVHPYSNLDTHRQAGPLIISRGSGVYVEDEHGKRYLEGMSGLWCASLGFDEARLVDAAIRQMKTLPFYHIFNHRSHQPAIELAERLTTMAPAGLSKVLFANSGSEANDAAIKLAWYYNNALDRPKKKKLISRHRGYHGVTVATGSLTGLAANHTDFDLPIAGVLHTDCPSFYHYGRSGESEEAFCERLANNLERLILDEGPDTIAAFFAEPVNGSGGVIVPPMGYFPRIQKILRKYDILFVVDEVICGFGRTGNMFGSQTFGLEPDMMTTAKALSAAYMPISALLVNDKVYDAMVRESQKIGLLAHGITYAGHPVCAAVALEALKIYEERDIVGHVRSVAPRLQNGLRRLSSHPLVGEARGIGLIGALELARDKDTREAFRPEDGVGAFVQKRTLERGLMIRTLRDGAIAVCPPLIVNEKEIDELLGILADVLDDTQAMLDARGIRYGQNRHAALAAQK